MTQGVSLEVEFKTQNNPTWKSNYLKRSVIFLWEIWDNIVTYRTERDDSVGSMDKANNISIMVCSESKSQSQFVQALYRILEVKTRTKSTLTKRRIFFLFIYLDG